MTSSTPIAGDRRRRGPLSRRLVVTLIVVLGLVVASLAAGIPFARAAEECALDTVCEAELGDLHDGAGVEDEHAGYTGTGFVDQLFDAAGVVLAVDAPEAGAHQVTIRYANGDAGNGLGSRNFTMTVNGTTDVPVLFPQTGSWTSWSTVTVPVNLPAGVSELDIRTGDDNNGPINVDHIVVSAVDGVDEQGVTMRIFDVDTPLQELCTLKPGQTPNVDVLRPVVDWSTAEDWEGYTENFVAQVVADLEVAEAGEYSFRLTSDDGSRLFVDGEEVIDNDGVHGAESVEVTGTLTEGTHAIEIDYFQAGGGGSLALEWQQPGSSTFEVVPNSVLTTEGGGARVVAPGVKECEGATDQAGDGLPLDDVHPSFDLQDLRPGDDFQPDVSGLAWYPDGSLAVLTWGKSQLSASGKLYRVTNVQGDVDLDDVEVTEIASDLQEPQGVQIVEGDVYVSTKAGLDRLVDDDDDGFFEGRDRLAEWPYANNYHEFAFGLPYRDGYFYVALSSALDRAGLTVVPQPSPDRGTVVRVDKDTGEMAFIAGGLRTPNGIAWGPNGNLLITDNQGGWLPSSKLVEIEEGHFYNQFTSFEDPDTGEMVDGRFDDQPVTEPVVWMPQNEIANSPSTPVTMVEGPFAGQLAIGDVTYGGLQRVFLEEVDGKLQGALYRMTQGLEAGVNEVSVGPDGDLYLGGIGYDGNWNQPGKLRYGLQKLSANDMSAMDILSTEITESGFDMTYTKPLSEATRADLVSAYEAEQWSYHPTSSYGGPKLGQEELEITGASVSEDGTTVSLDIPGIEPGHVVHVRSPRPFTADDGEELWNTEVWYTASVVPGHEPPAAPFVEAEDSVALGDARTATDQGGFSGAAFVDEIDDAGSGVRFPVEADEAGTFDLGIRYANGAAPPGGTRTISLVVNGEFVRQVQMPSTVSWNRWATARERVTLEAGANQVEVVVGDGDTGAVNIDALSVRPSGERITLIDDRDLSEWQHTDGREPGWTEVDEGVWEVCCGDLRTKDSFEDYSLHVEFWLPEYPDDVTGQARANSGVYNQERYEIQVLDSYGIDPPQTNDAGAIYEQKAPDVNAATPPETWQTYDIDYTAARYDDTGQKVSNARITVEWNGQLIHDDVEILGATTAGAAESPATGAIMLQDHGNPVRYRNVWIEPEYDAVPELTATAEPTSGVAPLEVDFAATATDPEGTDVTYEWEFGDGSESVTTADATHTYTSPGAYRAAVRATDEAGRTASRSFLIDVDADCGGWDDGASDDFDGDVLDRCRWTDIVREDADHVRVTGGNLEIDAQAGDMNGGNVGAVNLVLQDAPEDDWEAITKVTLPSGAASYEQAGLILHEDDQDFAKLVVIDVPGQGWQGEFSQTINGNSQFNAGQDRSVVLTDDIEDDGIWLRMTRSEDSLTGAWSLDGETWTTFGRAFSTDPFPDAGLGLAAFNGNGQTAAFEAFTIPGDGPEPDTGDQQITVTVPEQDTGDGEFLWSIEGDGAVDLGETSDEGSFLQATGALDPIVVTDTREGGPQWSIAGQVDDFTDELGGEHLGWTPEVLDPGAGATAGEPVAPGIDGGDGLSVPATLASAEAGHDLGTGRVGAELDLRFPAATAPGEYQATLTITALS